MKRITLQVALTIPDETTVADVLNAIDSNRVTIADNQILHLDYKIISRDKIKTRIMENGESLGYAAELKPL